MALKTETNSSRRIELILQQVESLPTLPGVAMRLLQLTSAEDSDARQVIDLVRNDQALTGKVLALCRHAHAGVRSDTVTVDRAVVLLGFEAIRNAVLSIKVFEAFAEDTDQPEEPGQVHFDRPAFWKHSLAVGVAAEMIAAAHPKHKDLKPPEAFVCGLLHDLGKLALEYVLPKSYQRVVELAIQSQGNIAQIERKVIGLDHHTAGKRLAEHWQLPHVLQDAMWLHGVPFDTLPELEHRRLVGLIGLADLVVRQQHIGYSGNFQLRDDLAQRAEQLGLDAARVRDASSGLMEELERRGSVLGVGDQPTRQMFLESIMQANELLGRLNSQLESRRVLADGQGRSLQAIVRFHESASSVGRSVHDVLKAVVMSASASLGKGYYGILYQAGGDEQWQITQYNLEGAIVRSQLIDPPPNLPQLSSLNQPNSLSVDWMSVIPWISDYLLAAQDVRLVRLMPLPCGWGTSAVLLHDRKVLPPVAQLEALMHTWGASIAAAAQHEGARRLGEQLAEANHVLTQTQESLLKTQTMARLGEMAAGAAHEMNNPLAVISGRSQMLATSLPEGSKSRDHAQMISQQSQKLSDLITALHLFADPPKPRYQAVSLIELVEKSVKQTRQLEPDAPAIRVNTMDKLPRAWTDGQQVAAALSELLLNAAQARPHHPVELAIQVDAINDRLIFVVSDDGVGMDAHTIEHAFDPFFSAKQAGRRSGLGLAKARRLVEGLGGDIELRSTAGKGTTARLSIPLIDPPIGQHNAPPSTPHENESDETSVPGGSRAVDFQKT